MKQEHIARLLDDMQLTLDEFAASCTVTPEWVIEHVHAGVLLTDPDPDPQRWVFRSEELRRTRRLCHVERTFDANPELAGLVADLLDELERLRTRLRCAGLPLE